MKRIIKYGIPLLISAILSIGLSSCKKDEAIVETKIVEKIPATFTTSISMEQLVNGQILQLNSPNTIYQNKKGQNFNVTRLRYLISDISFHKSDGNSFSIDEYHLVDVSDSSTFTFYPKTKVPEGKYESISFTFGFDAKDNQTGINADLNILNWQWPLALGGGYHYMQLEGNYDSAGVSKVFATHMGKARDASNQPYIFENNHFQAFPDSSGIDISSDFHFSIIMNVEQWYENPYTWDFNLYNTSTMPNYDAQKKLNLNGPSVFSIKTY